MKCRHCDQPINFNSASGMWLHVNTAITGHAAQPPKESRGEAGPDNMYAQLPVRLRCTKCAEPVKPLQMKGYIHDYPAIGEKLKFVRPEIVLTKLNMKRDLVCDGAIVDSAEAGSYDNLQPVKSNPLSTGAMDLDTRRYKAINAAMTVYFYEELTAANGEADWFDIRYRNHQQCDCPTCKFRELNSLLSSGGKGGADHGESINGPGDTPA